MKITTRVVQGAVLDDSSTFTLHEFCRICGVDQTVVIEMVEEGVIDVSGEAGECEWRFNGTTLVRARRAIRLRHDLDVNWPGAALALELLDELAGLRVKATK